MLLTNFTLKTLVGSENTDTEGAIESARITKVDVGVLL